MSKPLHVNTKQAAKAVEAYIVYEHGGDQAAAARHLGVSEALVSLWISGKRRVSIAIAETIERESGGRISATQVRG